jgi:hypothetical protein
MHTPLKSGLSFTTHNHPTRRWEISIYSAKGETVATVRGASESEAEAIRDEFVTAVHCHAELLAAVRIAEEYITHELNAPLGTRIEQRKITLPMLRAAIANAERQAQS